MCIRDSERTVRCPLECLAGSRDRKAVTDARKVEVMRCHPPSLKRGERPHSYPRVTPIG